MCYVPGATEAMVAGTAISSAGTLFGGISANAEAKRNASSLEQQAALREEKGKYDVEQEIRRYRRDQGTKQAVVAASGGDIQSFADIFADDAAESALAVQAIKFGATQDANNIRAQAASTRRRGQNALIGSVFSAAGQGLSGYGQAKQVRYAPSAYAPHEN